MFLGLVREREEKGDKKYFLSLFQNLHIIEVLMKEQFYWSHSKYYVQPNENIWIFTFQKYNFAYG